MKYHNACCCCCWLTYMFFLILSLSFILSNVLVLANSSLPNSLQHSQKSCHDHEKLALLQFKQSFLIDCHASDPEFARPKVESWQESSSDCCRWDGVECNEETGHVIGLDLSSSCLFGTFPSNSTIFGLAHLLELDLSRNDFNYSQIPSTISQLSKLTLLDLSYSNFGGQIPLEISQMSSLSILDISENYLRLPYGMSFEKLISNLSGLTSLSLTNVDISDVVPLCLTNFTSLRFLYLDGCNLYGHFPSDIFLLPNIEEVDLYDNSMLRGHLPEFPSNSPLRVLVLAETSFSGELSLSIGNLGNLSNLMLGFTGFVGSIPSSLGNLSKLTILEFTLCSFTGDLPMPLTNLTHLRVLALSYVNVRFEIVNSWLFKLKNLEYLALKYMNISGEFPPAIANHTKLYWLDVRGNQLRGPLPSWLANLTHLGSLDLRENQFQDPLIPQWFSQLINLSSLLLSSDSSSVAMFDPLLKLPNLTFLDFSGINLKFPSNNVAYTNSSFPRFGFVSLISCYLSNFPQFLHHQSKLEYLDLSMNNIVGSIPQWFVNGTAKSLIMLFLDSNSITGFEQPQGFLPWNNLQVLSIQDNKLQGQLPSPSPSLKVYQASQNYLSGIVPKQICKRSSLIFLDLSKNNFSGRIPSCIGSKLSASLKVLNFGSNNFQGTIPQAFIRSCKLHMIDFSDNELEGELPKSLTNCEQLEVFKVGNNHLDDTFPSWMGSLPRLEILLLRKNKFHGRITTLASRHQFNRLRILDMSNNFYVGDIPSEFLQNLVAMRDTSEGHMRYSSTFNSEKFVVETVINNALIPMPWTIPLDYPYSINITNKGTERYFPEILTVFRVLDLSSNRFTGVIPDVIGNLRGLQALNLSNNNLIGDIPSSLANIRDLQSLDLSVNMLSGEIPQQLTEITSLEVFNVSHNRLVGLIPQGEQFNTFDNSSFDGNSRLCGPPLSKKCRNTDSLQPSLPSDTRDEMEEEESMLVDWIIRLLGCASGCIVGFIIGKLYITDRYHDWFMETFGRRRKTRPKPNTRRSAPSARRHG